jgi:hypothetical protein
MIRTAHSFIVFFISPHYAAVSLFGQFQTPRAIFFSHERFFAFSFLPLFSFSYKTPIPLTQCFRSASTILLMTIALNTPSPQSPNPDEETWTPKAPSIANVKIPTDSSSSELADFPHAPHHTKSPAETALVKKINWHILPFVFGCVFIQCKSFVRRTGVELTTLFFGGDTYRC